MSLFTHRVTPQLAEHALDLAEPMLKKLMATDTIKRSDLHIVVAIRDANLSPYYDMVAQRSYGDQAEWEHPYDRIAHGKTRITGRTGKTSRQVQLTEPELLVTDDVMYWGNATMLGIIVSCSGVQPWFDEVISNAILWIIYGLIQNQMDHLHGQGGDFYDD